MDLQIFTIDESETWDRIVSSFKNYDIYYLSTYVKAFELQGDGIPLLFYFNNGNTRAINVSMKRDISSHKNFTGKIPPNTYFDLSTVYGYGGFIVEGTDTEQLSQEYMDYCINNNIISEFVRFHPLLENHKLVQGIYDIEKLGVTVSLDLDSIDEIWANIHSKNKNMIRKAINSELKIYWGRDSNLVDKFIEIYNDTMRRNNAADYYFFDTNFYNSILDDLKYDSLFFYTKLKKEIISMSIILLGNEKIHYHLSASKKEYQNLAPSNLLIYEAACWGCKNGFKKFHLGGGLGSKKDNLYKFKKSFNKNEDKDYFIGKKIFDESIYKKLVDIRLQKSDATVNTEYFPLYRG